MSDLVISVIDLACQAADQSFLPPRVTMLTKSTTQIATVLGYSEYIPSTPPKKYKTLTWSGASEQTAITTGTGDKVGDAKYIYGGAGSIDSHGNIVSSYTKDFYSPCPASNFTPSIVISPVIPRLVGYCWHLDPASCPTCSDPPEFKEDVAANLTFDEPNGLLGVGTGFHTLTATTLTNVGQQTVTCALADAGPNSTTNVPHDTFNGFNAAWVTVIANHNYTATLSDEYTDAEALANAQVIQSNGATAENRPRTTGFVSRFTSVIYELHFSDLIVGQSYVATVTLFYQNPFNTVIKSVGFVATATTKTLIDVVPTPVAGGSITVKSPTVAFSP